MASSSRGTRSHFVKTNCSLGGRKGGREGGREDSSSKGSSESKMTEEEDEAGREEAEGL